MVEKVKLILSRKELLALLLKSQKEANRNPCSEQEAIRQWKQLESKNIKDVLVYPVTYVTG